MKVKFYGVDGTLKEEREIVVPTFQDDRGVQALKEVILAYQTNLRQGNASTKTRGDVKGSGKKPYRQKGTGMARHGEKRSPIWRGGGIVFGPKPRDFSVSINKKVKRLALQRALFERLNEAKVGILEGISTLEKPKTATLSAFFEKIVTRGKLLLIDKLFEKNVLLSTRNLDWVYTVDALSLNAWDLVRYENVLFTEQAFEAFLNRIQS